MKTTNLANRKILIQGKISTTVMKDAKTTKIKILILSTILLQWIWIICSQRSQLLPNLLFIRLSQLEIQFRTLQNSSISTMYPLIRLQKLNLRWSKMIYWISLILQMIQILLRLSFQLRNLWLVPLDQTLWMISKLFSATLKLDTRILTWPQHNLPSNNSSSKIKCNSKLIICNINNSWLVTTIISTQITKQGWWVGLEGTNQWEWTIRWCINSNYLKCATSKCRITKTSL